MMGQSATRQPDYYKLLGVPSSATPEEIRRAYRKAMKDIHPDRQTPEDRLGAEERAKTLNAAYTTLSQPERRRQYDSTLRAAVVQDQIMQRYTGDMHIPGNARDPFTGQPVRPRYPSERARREQEQADRSATSSLFFVFGGAALFVVLAILMFAIIGLAINYLT
jgi:DnaJ-class molecular chaperone